jgi:hypothetical protein
MERFGGWRRESPTGSITQFKRPDLRKTLDRYGLAVLAPNLSKAMTYLAHCDIGFDTIKYPGK